MSDEYTELILFANKYKLSLLCFGGTDEHRTYKFVDDLHIGITLDPSTKSFSFTYSIPHSIFTMECPSCAPYDREGHFNSMYRNFKSTVKRYLYGSCED